jgi:acetolactate synthase regulatory subunit
MNTVDISQPTERLAGTSVWNLLSDLRSFDNQDLLVKMSFDGGRSLETLRLQLDDLLLDYEVSIKRLVEWLRLHAQHPDCTVRLISADGKNQWPVGHLVKRRGYCVLHVTAQ